MTFQQSLDKLAKDFATLNWDFKLDHSNKHNELISQWLGDINENTMICVYHGKDIHEPFHRQDFFFFNFAYHNSYKVQNAQSGATLLINENDCYVGQPYSGYAILNNNQEVTIIGVLIKKEVFFDEYLGVLAQDSDILRFFLEPQNNKFSNEYLKLHFDKDSPIWHLLKIMVIEYANKKVDTQNILKPLILALTMFIARKYHEKSEKTTQNTLSDKILTYLGNNSIYTLKEIASTFGYHPNYISKVIHDDTGKTFSYFVLKNRMEKAYMLLKNTNLSVERIAEILNYTNTSDFYKAFKKYYGHSPREQVNI